MHQRIGTVALGVTSLIVAGSAAGLAATKASASASGKTYKACLTKHHKLTHVTTGSAPTCTAAGSHLVIWNQRGPRGANGRPGQNGEDGSRGPQGPQGPAGITDVQVISKPLVDPDSEQIELVDDPCPNGTEAISGWGTVSFDSIQFGTESAQIAENAPDGAAIYSSGPDTSGGLPDAWEVDWSANDEDAVTFTVYEVCADVSQQSAFAGTR